MPTKWLQERADGSKNGHGIGFEGPGVVSHPPLRQSGAQPNGVSWVSRRTNWVTDLGATLGSPTTISAHQSGHNRARLGAAPSHTAFRGLIGV